jgi:hypothetical protein
MDTLTALSKLLFPLPNLMGWSLTFQLLAATFAGDCVAGDPCVEGTSFGFCYVLPGLLLLSGVFVGLVFVQVARWKGR